MTYDSGLLASTVNLGREATHHWLLEFAHRQTPVDENVRQFIRDFKAGSEQALCEAVALVSGAVSRLEWHFRDVLDCRYLVAAPRHLAGPPTPAFEALCAAVCDEFSWLTWSEAALQRTTTVGQSRGTAPADRPTVDQHLDSIAYHGPREPNLGTIIIFDDVLATGATAAACHQIARSAGARNALGLYLARVWLDPASSSDRRPPSSSYDHS